MSSRCPNTLISCNNFIRRRLQQSNHINGTVTTFIASQPSRCINTRCISGNNKDSDSSSSSQSTRPSKSSLDKKEVESSSSSSSSSSSKSDNVIITTSDSKNIKNSGTLASSEATTAATTNNKSSKHLIHNDDKTSNDTVNNNNNNDNIKPKIKSTDIADKTSSVTMATATKEEEKLSSSPSSSSSSSSSSTSSSALTKFLKHCQAILEESSGLFDLVQLKQAVQDASNKFDIATNQVEKNRYDVLVAQKAHEQAHKRHVNLLMRRDEWDTNDAQSFVTITSEEVATRQALSDAQNMLRQAEEYAIKCQHSYMDKMRQRYHEEQMWQDKWRLFGTYGTWSLIGLNTLVFIAGQYRTNQREMQRMNHMEQLLLQQQQQFDSEESLVDNRNNNQNFNHKHSTEQQNNASEGDDSAKNFTMAKLLFHQYTYKGISYHPPSMLLGAITTASCVILVSLLRGNR